MILGYLHGRHIKDYRGNCNTKDPIENAMGICVCFLYTTKRGHIRKAMYELKKNRQKRQ